VGLSTHTPQQLARALALSPEYVAYGPVFPTTSKENPDAVVGLAGLREAAIAARRARVPLVAIGGITLTRASEVASISDAAAVISALLPDGPGALNPKDVLDAVLARALALQAALSPPRAESSEKPVRATI
jgi:thiamine-phosphate pyrophosphorylase